MEGRRLPKPEVVGVPLDPIEQAEDRDEALLARLDSLLDRCIYELLETEAGSPAEFGKLMSLGLVCRDVNAIEAAMGLSLADVEIGESER